LSPSEGSTTSRKVAFTRLAGGIPGIAFHQRL
jgi:hypothetical protein